MKNYTFSSFNKFSSKGICTAIENLNPKALTPVIICVGSDMVVGDSLGPLVGTMLKQRKVDSYVYGTLNYPLTAKEISYAQVLYKKMHPNTISIAIDAAVGCQEDVGIIKVVEDGLYPGLGVNKRLGKLGDISIIGVVAGKSFQNYNLYNLTRLNLIYKMAEIIADGVEEYIKSLHKNFSYPSVEENF